MAMSTLTVKKLQELVKKTLDEERAIESLRTEVNRVLGPAVIAEGRAEQVAEAANNRIDVLERTGRSSRLFFEPSVMVRWLDHTSPEVRKFAARVVPEKFLVKMVNDRSDIVRAAVARRLPIGAVSEMLKRFPKDDQVRVIYKQKRLAEAGVKQPEEQPLGHDPVEAAERLGDSVKQDEGSDLSEVWYRERAIKFMQDYGGNIEDTWEEITARRYCASVKATAGVEIDEAKLLKAIKDLIKEREDRALERSALKETLAWLREQEERELLQESAMPIIDTDVDPVRELVEGNLTPTTFLSKANRLFQVKEATVPPGIRKHRLGERSSKQETIPVVGRLPHAQGFRGVDERALDMYCRHWNDRQQLRGEPLKLEWSNHPDEIGKVSFNVILR
jgi:hypothetical protein